MRGDAKECFADEDECLCVCLCIFEWIYMKTRALKNTVLYSGIRNVW